MAIGLTGAGGDKQGQADDGGQTKRSFSGRRHAVLGDPGYSPFKIPSTIFLASPNSIMVLSRKKSSFSTPA